jgi:ABC-type transport system involved in multi-copper enzyme maturation permease subunit
MLITVVAANTAREALRSRSFLLLLAVFGVGVLLAPVVGWISATDGRVVTTDLVFSLLSVVGVLVAVATGTALVHNEMQQRTIYTVLSRPIPRWQFVVGKYLGLVVALVIGQVAMLLLASLALLCFGAVFNGLLLLAGALIIEEVCLMAAVSLCWTSLSSPLLAAVLSLATYALGHAVGSLPYYINHLEGAQKWLVVFLASCIPNLSGFAYRNQAVYGEAPAAEHWLAVGTGLLWIVFLVTVTVAVLRRKQL